MEKLAQSFYLIRFPDCDPFGHLNNSKYIDYLLNAREDHLRDAYHFDLNTAYQKGHAWMVASHQIQFIRPAQYNEKVCIQSSLIDAGESHLLVEMSMWNEAATQCKAVLWTKFTHVSLASGKRAIHSDEFNQFARSVLRDDVKVQDGLEKRIGYLIASSKATV